MLVRDRFLEQDAALDRPQRLRRGDQFLRATRLEEAALAVLRALPIDHQANAYLGVSGP